MPRAAGGARMRAFTLIELLVVVAIIAILAGLILQTAGYVQRKAAMSRAEAEIGAISAALESYKADYGDYPTEGDDWDFVADGSEASSEILIHALGVASNEDLNPLNKVYLELPGSSFDTPENPMEASAIFDPFGTPYRYEYPGETNRSGTNFFDLWSYSGTPTSGTETNRWIKNW